MKVEVASQRAPELIDALTALWERSVRATHSFLKAGDVERIRDYVPDLIREVPVLLVASNAAGDALGFAGADGDCLEMLFVEPCARGTGVGRALAERAVDYHGVARVTVNEQNPQAVGFYEHMGFRAYRRTDLDEQGDPYPLLYMELDRGHRPVA